MVEQIGKNEAEWKEKLEIAEAESLAIYDYEAAAFWPPLGLNDKTVKRDNL